MARGSAMLSGVALLLCVLSATFVADAQKTNVIKVGGLFPMFKPNKDTSGIKTSRLHHGCERVERQRYFHAKPQA